MLVRAVAEALQSRADREAIAAPRGSKRSGQLVKAKDYDTPTSCSAPASRTGSTARRSRRSGSRPRRSRAWAGSRPSSGTGPTSSSQEDPSSGARVGFAASWNRFEKGDRARPASPSNSASPAPTGKSTTSLRCSRPINLPVRGDGRHREMQKCTTEARRAWRGPGAGPAAAQIAAPNDLLNQWEKLFASRDGLERRCTPLCRLCLRGRFLSTRPFKPHRPQSPITGLAGGRTGGGLKRGIFGR